MNEKQISAQVLLTPTAVSNPEQLRQAFEQIGFRTTKSAQTTFAISGPANLFEHFFGVKLETSSQGVRVSGGEGSADSLPLNNLPAALQSSVEQIVFTRPLDFGPGANY